MGLTDKKTIVFVTGTRADFGKLQSLIKVANSIEQFEVHIFVTGMHLLRLYGYTAIEVYKAGFTNIHKFINQNTTDSMDVILAKTIHGFSDFVKEIKPDMIIIHGDRIEALACAIVGSLNNIRVAHIEGGEVSGTVDELLRHSITKLAHLHLACNKTAQRRLLQLGETQERIKIIGSPDLDVMGSEDLPNLEIVKEYYQISYSNYAIFMYHPVVTELDQLQKNIDQVMEAACKSEDNFIAVFPNNDDGSDIIINALESVKDNKRFRIFPSIRFEYFLTLLKNAAYIIGNSSAGIREAPFYGVPTVNIGTRQLNRAQATSICNVDEDSSLVLNSISTAKSLPKTITQEFGDGKSALHFEEFITTKHYWNIPLQKHFNDNNDE